MGPGGLATTDKKPKRNEKESINRLNDKVAQVGHKAK